MIRLAKQQQQAIKQLTLEFFNTSKVKIFGSRANVDQKGGDIDIYI